MNRKFIQITALVLAGLMVLGVFVGVMNSIAYKIIVFGADKRINF